MTKKTKKIIPALALFLVLLFNLSACSKSGARDDIIHLEGETGYTEKLLDGFTGYSDSSLPIGFQYPDSWTILDKDDTETLDRVNKITGIPTEDYLEKIQNITAVLYDFENAANGFIPSVNLVIASSNGMTQENLLDNDFKEKLINSIYSQLSSSPSFRKLAEPSVKMIGDNFFLTFQSAYMLDSANIESYLALTVMDGSLCSFTFYTIPGQLEQTLPQYDEMLSTVSVN